MTALAWIGARARWVLLIGALLAVFLPDVSSFLRPAVPVFIAMVYMLAMLRIDIAAVARGMLNGRHAARTEPSDVRRPPSKRISASAMLPTLLARA